MGKVIIGFTMSEVLANNRPATLAQAISKTKATAPNNISSLLRMSLTRSCCSGMTAASEFQSGAAAHGKRGMICEIIGRISCCACSMDIPARNLATSGIQP
jgi:hypothetical protein